MAQASKWLPPVGLYVLAAVIGFIAISRIPFPISEVSAYITDVGANLVSGRGLVSDSAWSFASGPPDLPRPAFDLWQPLPGIQAAIGMLVLGPSFAAAQTANVLVAAWVAPLAWLIGRDAAGRNALGPERAAAISLGAGLVVAVLGPFLVAAVAPDSSAPFTVLAVAACLVMPRALTGSRGAGLVLGVLLGLAYLARQEAIWLALAYLVLALGPVAVRRWPAAAWAASRWVLLAGALVTIPWLVRNAVVFEGGALRQALENVWLTRNEQIFAYLERPNLNDWLAGAPGAILERIVAGFGHDLVSVLLIPLGPVGIVGLASGVALWRTPALREVGALRALVVSAVITFIATGLLFPVATRWGTYQHSSGPTVVALVVLALLGLDAVVAVIARRRSWARANAWLGPVALLALVMPLAVVTIQSLAGQADREASRQAAIRAAFASLDDARGGVITDHPMWVAASTGRDAVALPDEGPDAILRLAADARADWLLVLDQRGRYPAALLGASVACLTKTEIAVFDADLWRIDPGCR
jgi:hypothetical protein